MSTGRLPLLFIGHALPYPPDGGMQIRTYNVLRLLSERYEIDALSFYRRAATQAVEASLAGLRPFVRSIEAFPIPQEHSRSRLLRDHLTSTLGRSVYTRHAFADLGVRRRIRSLLASRTYALVHLDSLDLSSYLPDLTHLRVVCVHHNVESMLLKRRARLERSRLRSAYLRMQANFMGREEAHWAPRVALNVVCSPADRSALERIAPGARVAVVPNGVDVHAFRPGPQPDNGLVFVGGMTWFPNKDALEHFTADIWPRIQRLGHRPRVEWVGHSLAGMTETFAARGITLTGYVDDVRPRVHRARCYVVPLRVGGGTRLKILDAWAMGKAVVSTSVGCEGLDARDGWNILIRDDPEEFALAVVDVLSDPALRDHLAANARLTAERVYAWEQIGVAMLAEYAAVSRFPGAP